MMSKTKLSLLLMLVIGLMVVSVIEISAKTTADKSDFTIREVKQQFVLYTIYRGSYDKTGKAIGRLFALAGHKEITPRGPLSYAYLNNPQQVSSEHWLTEIRIPVGKEALKLAGTLGEMTDVKALPAMEVAVAIKPKGKDDPGPIYDKLFAWILKQGYMGVGGPMETFLNGGTAGQNYAQMKTEIMLPVRKIPKQKG
jgi:effector-binding domain-containing protein